MRATVWSGRNTVQVESVPDPKILNKRDAIVKVTSTAICGSDLHLYDGYIPTVKRGDILGHEFMGEVVEKGGDVLNLNVGDRVVVPFPIACGNCNNCQNELYSVCENSNPNANIAEALHGHSPSGIYGYSHMMGGYAGGQAEYVRVPFADVGPIRIENDLPDESVLMLSDIFPTGWMGAEMCNIEPGDIVAVWGAGPVGQFAIASAFLLGAERVIAIDQYDYRLEMAREKCGAETIDFQEEEDVVERLKEMTGGRGPDACIDAVGMEADGPGPDDLFDRAQQVLRIQLERVHVVREAIMACRKGGVVSIVGVYVGFVDKLPLGAAMNKGLTIRTGQTHVNRWTDDLLRRIEEGQIDPTFVITHTVGLDDGPAMYKTFREKEDGCIKVVLKP